jgi:hypothetical protein
MTRTAQRTPHPVNLLLLGVYSLSWKRVYQAVVWQAEERDIQTHRQQSDLISLLSFFQNNKSGLVSGTLDIMCNEAVVACFNVLSWHSSGEAEGSTKHLNRRSGLDSC